MRILHITPHLGGGVGKAVSALALRAAHSHPGQRHAVACLEVPEKIVNARALTAAGIELLVAPDLPALARACAAADIVQVEFWNHPALVHALCRTRLAPLRLLVWTHVSGLHEPMLPPALLRAAHLVVFSSECSLQAPEVHNAPVHMRRGFRVISSGVGVEHIEFRARPLRRDGALRAGYVGSMNLSKLHPSYVAMVAPAALSLDSGLTVRMVGDPLNRDCLQQESQEAGCADLFEFRGFRSDVFAEFAEFDIHLYLLNPLHYGTAENSLLESMAAGVVPIVLDNPAERALVEHGRTGFVVRTPEDVRRSLERLDSDRSLLSDMGWAASQAVRERFSDSRMAEDFAQAYESVASLAPRSIDFEAVFGTGPAEWFRAFQREPLVFRADGSVHRPDDARWHGLFDITKGTIFHFAHHFPDDPLLKRWSDALQLLRAAS